MVLSAKTVNMWLTQEDPKEVTKTETGSLADTYMYVDWQSLP